MALFELCADQPSLPCLSTCHKPCTLQHFIFRILTPNCVPGPWSFACLSSTRSLKFCSALWLPVPENPVHQAITPSWKPCILYSIQSLWIPVLYSIPWSLCGIDPPLIITGTSNPPKPSTHLALLEGNWSIDLGGGNRNPFQLALEKTAHFLDVFPEWTQPWSALGWRSSLSKQKNVTYPCIPRMCIKVLNASYSMIFFLLPPQPFFLFGFLNSFYPVFLQQEIFFLFDDLSKTFSNSAHVLISNVCCAVS